MKRPDKLTPPSALGGRERTFIFARGRNSREVRNTAGSNMHVAQAATACCTIGDAADARQGQTSCQDPFEDACEDEVQQVAAPQLPT